MRLRPMAYEALHYYWRVRRGMTLGARTAVFDDAGRVLLVQHTYVAGWHFPGGGVEPRHTLVETAIKELREETGVIATEDPRLHGIFLNAPFLRDHVAVFVLRRFEAGPTFAPNLEIKAATFFPVDELPAETTPGTRRRLAEILHGEAIGRYW